jgi:hypothetical protein
MKLNGKALSGPAVEIVVIPRQDGDLVFKAQAVLDYDDHDKINPQPKPPVVIRPGGVESVDMEDKKYNEKLDTWARQKFYWMFLKSLAATDGLEWETVDMSDPLTWELYKEEMQTGGLAPAEVQRIELCVTNACGLNQSKIDEATNRFLAGQAQVRAAESSPSSAPTNTPSGEPANASA